MVRNVVHYHVDAVFVRRVHHFYHVLVRSQTEVYLRRRYGPISVITGELRLNGVGKFSPRFKRVLNDRGNPYRRKSHFVKIAVLYFLRYALDVASEIIHFRVHFGILFVHRVVIGSVRIHETVHDERIQYFAVFVEAGHLPGGCQRFSVFERGKDVIRYSVAVGSYHTYVRTLYIFRFFGNGYFQQAVLQVYEFHRQLVVLPICVNHAFRYGVCRVLRQYADTYVVFIEAVANEYGGFVQIALYVHERVETAGVVVDFLRIVLVRQPNSVAYYLVEVCTRGDAECNLVFAVLVQRQVGEPVRNPIVHLSGQLHPFVFFSLRVVCECNFRFITEFQQYAVRYAVHPYCKVSQIGYALYIQGYGLFVFRQGGLHS